MRINTEIVKGPGLTGLNEKMKKLWKTLLSLNVRLRIGIIVNAKLVEQVFGILSHEGLWFKSHPV